jgi:hypothetical protein
MDRGHKKALRLLLEQHPIVASWPTSAVVSFFEAIGLHQYASTMDKMSVNGRQLSKATLDSLAAVFCISSFGHRSSIIQALEYCAKHSPALQPTMHSGALVSQFAVEDELSARSMMRRRQAWKKYESFRDRAAMPPIKNYTKVVMNKSDIDKLLASPDARREAWIEYMTQPAAVAAPSRVKSPPREGLSDKERAAIERKFSYFAAAWCSIHHAQTQFYSPRNKVSSWAPSGARRRAPARQYFVFFFILLLPI